MRIINQEGLFFYNHSPYEPIESVYKGFYDLFVEKAGKEKADEIFLHDTFSGCLNFHKKYVTHTKEKLRELQITKEYMIPDIERLKRYCMN